MVLYYSWWSLRSFVRSHHHHHHLFYQLFRERSLYFVWSEDRQTESPFLHFSIFPSAMSACINIIMLFCPVFFSSLFCRQIKLILVLVSLNRRGKKHNRGKRRKKKKTKKKKKKRRRTLDNNNKYYVSATTKEETRRKRWRKERDVLPPTPSTSTLLNTTGGVENNNNNNNNNTNKTSKDVIKYIELGDETYNVHDVVSMKAPEGEKPYMRKFYASTCTQTRGEEESRQEH